MSCVAPTRNSGLVLSTGSQITCPLANSQRVSPDSGHWLRTSSWKCPAEGDTGSIALRMVARTVGASSRTTYCNRVSVEKFIIDGGTNNNSWLMRKTKENRTQEKPKTKKEKNHLTWSNRRSKDNVLKVGSVNHKPVKEKKWSCCWTHSLCVHEIATTYPQPHLSKTQSFQSVRNN